MKTHQRFEPPGVCLGSAQMDGAERDAAGAGLQTGSVRRHQRVRLHAAVRYVADERRALEQLCRYITRPALANERVQTNAAGQVVLKLKTPWRDGTTHLVISPLEFIQWLAAMMLRPRLHQPLTVSRPSISAVGCPVWVGQRRPRRRTHRLRVDLRTERPDCRRSRPAVAGQLRALASGRFRRPVSDCCVAAAYHRRCG